MISKRELMDVAWPRLVVEENNLNVQVLGLRKVLGHAAIATVPGRGFRFTMPVEVEGSAFMASPSATPIESGENEPAASASNLPSRLPTLYGRADDVAAVSALLAAHPVVTLTGAGGIGKTRLGQAVASGVLTDYADGVWWVELAAVSNESFVAATIAHALGVQFDGARPAADAVLSALRSQHTLLVLDNCEHLLDAVAAFVDSVCSSAPKVRVLVTSQEALKTANEQVYRLGTLGLPAGDMGDARLAAGVVAASGAGALFVARACAADPHFSLGAANADAVAEICRRLDGIPLAIELAAARLPLLGIEGVRTHLKECFNVLTGGTRAVLRRHQTLRAALDWSHGMLNAAEQAVFRRLGVFTGGFTLETAQQVAEDDAIDVWDVLEHLGTLVDKSLVLAEGDPVPRYRMLETTRLFALEQLGKAGETEAMLRRHAEAMVALLDPFERNRDRLTPRDDGLLAVEADNVRAALDWITSAPGSGVDVLAVELGGLAGYSLSNASGWSEAFDRTVVLSPRVSASTPPQAAARFWLTLSWVGSAIGRIESYDAAVRAADLYRRLGDPERVYAALTARIAIGARIGQSATLEPLVREARSIERPDWPTNIRSSFRWASYRWLQAEGRFEEALASALERASLEREAGFLLLEQVHLGDIVADSELALGRVDAAEEHARNSLAALEGQPEYRWAVPHALEMLAVICTVQGKHEEAIERGRAALHGYRASGQHFRLLEPMALNAALQGRLRDAAWAAGHVDQVYMQRGEVRWPSVKARRAQLDALLAAGIGPADRGRLLRDGAAADIDVAFRHAFGDEQ
jgi:predicted ATPase